MNKLYLTILILSALSLAHLPSYANYHDTSSQIARGERSHHENFNRENFNHEDFNRRNPNNRNYENRAFENRALENEGLMNDANAANQQPVNVYPDSNPNQQAPSNQSNIILAPNSR